MPTFQFLSRMRPVHLILSIFAVVFFVLLFGILLTQQSFAVGNTYYVDGTNGNNTRAGTSLATAWKTIEYAETKVQPGDRVEIADGTYVSSSASGYFLFSKNGTAGTPITFEAINSGAVTLTSTSTSRIAYLNASYRTFKGLVFDAQHVASYAVIDVTGKQGNVFDGITVKNANSTGLYCVSCMQISNSNASGNSSIDFRMDASTALGPRSISNLQVSTSSAYGIYISGDNVSVTNLNITNYQQTGAVVYIYGGNNNTIASSTFVGPGKAAITIRSVPPTKTAMHNVIDSVNITTTGPLGYGISIGVEGYTLAEGTDGNIIRNSSIIGQNSTTLHSVLISGGAKDNIVENTYFSNGAYGVVDKGAFNTIVRNSVFNDTPASYPALYAKGSTNSQYYNNIVRKVSNVGSAIYFATVDGTNNGTATSSTGILVKNNIIISGSGNTALSTFDSGERFTSDYNLFSKAGNLVNLNGIMFASLAAWQSSSSTPDAHSIAGTPTFVGNYTKLADFAPQAFSPAIDIGTPIAGRTADVLGNPIYGLPDAGPFEYQPPYTMGTDPLPVQSGVRVYGDGKFRYLFTASSTTANLSVTINGADRSQWLDVALSDWGSVKQWTEDASGSTGINSVLHVLKGLAPGASYTVSADGVTGQNISGCTNGVCVADSNGAITFTYNGAYGSHAFAVTSQGGGSGAAFSQVQVTPSGTSASITWSTDVPRDSGFYLLDSATAPTHSMTVTNLRPGTTYQFQLFGKDSTGNASSTSMYTFTTN